MARWCFFSNPTVFWFFFFFVKNSNGSYMSIARAVFKNVGDPGASFTPPPARPLSAIEYRYYSYSIDDRDPKNISHVFTVGNIVYFKFSICISDKHRYRLPFCYHVSGEIGWKRFAFFSNTNYHMNHCNKTRLFFTHHYIFKFKFAQIFRRPCDMPPVPPPPAGDTTDIYNKYKWTNSYLQYDIDIRGK